MQNKTAYSIWKIMQMPAGSIIGLITFSEHDRILSKISKYGLKYKQSGKNYYIIYR
jgi:hypothetical protein